MAFQRGDVVLIPFPTVQPAATVQALAEKSVSAVVSLASAGEPGVHLDRLRELLSA